MGPATAIPAPHDRVAPSGVVAFLFTDIEGSTQRWERDREAMQNAVRRHDGLMRTAIGHHRGYVFKTIGDAFCVAFASADDAISGALAAQVALANEDFSAVDGLRVRMAIHCGSADERDSDYFGPTVNRVARLLSIGHGGQLLLSQVTTNLAQSALDRTRLRDMGDHWLKDLREPEHVYQLDVPSGQTAFPALRSLGNSSSNLPREMTSFVGRETDVARVKELFKHARLVTLVGAGGVGKTRCSLKIGAELIATFADGVWFVDLAGVTDPALVATEVGAAFQVVESPKRPVLETLTAHLHKRNALILLDNCEHLIDACSRLAAHVLRSCPEMSFLATSREALKISGESVYALPTLDVPERTTGLSPEEASVYSAVALFLARARSADARFALTPDNTASVAEICRRLDGIPLALELAAARVKVLTPRQIERKLDERFRILTGGLRTALPRQQTMRALIDWSYDLLDERERALLCNLAIFAGSFSLETAIAICSSGTVEDFELLDLLTSLVEKSLVVAEPGEDDTRYRLLESMRQYGRERLDEQQGRRDVERRHAVAYMELAECLESDYDGTPYRAWVANAEREIENIRAALTWAFGADGDAAVGLRLAATLRRIFNLSFPAEARRWVQTALARVDPDTPQRDVARLELADAHLASTLNAFNAALAAAYRALALFESAGDRRGIANAQRWAGRSLIFLGDVEAGEPLLRSALATYSTLGFRQVGGLLRDLGSGRAAAGDLAGARELFARALTRFEADHDEGNIAITAGTLAEAEFAAGDPQAALDHARGALSAASRPNRTIALWILGNMAAFLVALDQFAEARVCAREALHSALQLESEIDVIVLLQHLAATLALEPDGEPATAARLVGYVDERMRKIDFVREFTERQEYERIVSALTSALGAEPLARLMGEGAYLNDDRAVELARSTPASAAASL